MAATLATGLTATYASIEQCCNMFLLNVALKRLPRGGQAVTMVLHSCWLQLEVDGKQSTA